MAWPDRGRAPAPLMVATVPYPLVYTPPEVEGAVVMAPVEGAERNSRFKMFWN